MGGFLLDLAHVCQEAFLNGRADVDVMCLGLRRGIGD